MIILLWTALLASASNAPDVVTVDKYYAREQLGGAPSVAQTRVALRDLNLRWVGPELLNLPSLHPEEEVSAVRVSGALHQRYDYQLALIPALGGTPVPAFDGVVLDDRQRVLANFSLKTVTVSALEALLQATAQIDEWSDLKSWARQLMRHTREWIGLHRHARVPTLRLTSLRVQRRFRERTRLFRTMIDVFGVGTGRPTWVIFDVVGFDPIPDEVLDAIRLHLGEHPKTERVYLHHAGTLRVITAAGVGPLSPACVTDLGG